MDTAMTVWLWVAVAVWAAAIITWWVAAHCAGDDLWHEPTCPQQEDGQ